MDTDTHWTLDVGHWHCRLEAEPVGAFFQPVVTCRTAQGAPLRLPLDTAPYASRAEALRHAQQQALRYVRHH